MSESFADKVVLVTGAGRGMGRGIAEAFSERGAKVIVSARSAERGQETVDRIRAAGGDAFPVMADNADRLAMKQMVEQGVAHYGRLDVVVHCAAHWVQGEILDMPEEDFNDLLQSNIHALFWLARDVAPHLSKAPGKGRLIFISSGSVNRQYLPGNICYSATKSYMNEFARGMAMEFGKHNILVNTVDPGFTATDRLLTMISEEVAQALTSTYPIPRPGTALDVANAVLFMASDAAAYITGTHLLVDGGSSMSPMPDLDKVLASTREGGAGDRP